MLRTTYGIAAESNRRKCRVWNNHGHVTTLPVWLFHNHSCAIFCDTRFMGHLSSSIPVLSESLNFISYFFFCIHWTDFVSNDVVLFRTGQPLLSDTIHPFHRRRLLSLTMHLCRIPTPGLLSGSSKRLATCTEPVDRGKPG